MGVVRRQGIKRTIVSFAGVLIGALSVLVVYPLAFGAYGLAQFIIATAGLLMPIATLGISRLTVRFFPEFKDADSGNHGFLGFLLLLSTVSFIIFLGVMFFLEAYVLVHLESFGMRKEVFQENKQVIYIVSYLLVLNSILLLYTSNFKRIVVPEIFNNLLIKIALPTLILLFYFKVIGLFEFKYLYAFSYFLTFVGLALYLHHLGHFSLKLDIPFVRKPMFREMMVYAAFNAFSTVGYLLSFRIDSIMIGFLSDLDSVGHYNFYSYIVNVMAVPYLAIVAITSPIIAENFKLANLTAISKIYRQSSETLFISGLFLVFVVWISLGDLLLITGKELVLWPLRSCYILLAVGQLINVTTGLNEQIIGYSRYYKFNLYAMGSLAVINVIMNIYLIPLWGIVGAAFATAVSLALYNTIKCLYIYFRFKIIPFSMVHFKVLLTLIAAYFITLLVPDSTILLLNIFFRTAVFTIIFVAPLIYFGVSPDLNNLWIDLLVRVRKIAKFKDDGTDRT